MEFTSVETIFANVIVRNSVVQAFCVVFFVLHIPRFVFHILQVSRDEIGQSVDRWMSRLCEVDSVCLTGDGARSPGE